MSQLALILTLLPELLQERLAGLIRQVLQSVPDFAGERIGLLSHEKVSLSLMLATFLPR
jgi:hypothetical protein